MIDWQSVAYGVCVSVLFLNAVMLVTLIVEAKARRQLDWVLDWIEDTAGRVKRTAERWLNRKW
jgi:hypothetical protein